jgi:hypothetical protein
MRRVGDQRAPWASIMISILNTGTLTATSRSNNILSGLAKNSRVRWFILITLFAVTVMAGTHEVLRIQSSREWITISLPNPPAPLPDDAAPSAAQTGMPDYR